MLTLLLRYVLGQHLLRTGKASDKWSTGTPPESFRRHPTSNQSLPHGHTVISQDVVHAVVEGQDDTPRDEHAPRQVSAALVVTLGRGSYHESSTGLASGVVASGGGTGSSLATDMTTCCNHNVPTVQVSDMFMLHMTMFECFQIVAYVIYVSMVRVSMFRVSTDMPTL